MAANTRASQSDTVPTELVSHLYKPPTQLAGPSHPGTAELQQVDGLPTDVHIVGNMFQEHGNTVLHLFGNEHVAMGPVKLVWTEHGQNMMICSYNGPDPRQWAQPSSQWLLTSEAEVLMVNLDHELPINISEDSTVHPIMDEPVG